jgi:hypothetical protein
MPRRSLLTIVLVLLASTVATYAADKDGFEDTFTLKPEDFSTTGKNDYFVLEPGYQLVLEGKTRASPPSSSSPCSTRRRRSTTSRPA